MKMQLKTGINLTEEDIQLLLDGMWNGTKILSLLQGGQIPRLLLRVVYNEENYHMENWTSALSLLVRNR